MILEALLRSVKWRFGRLGEGIQTTPCNKGAATSPSLFAICATFVHLVSSDQPVQAGITFHIGYVTSDPGL